MVQVSSWITTTTTTKSHHTQPALQKPRETTKRNLSLIMVHISASSSKDCDLWPDPPAPVDSILTGILRSWQTVLCSDDDKPHCDAQCDNTPICVVKKDMHISAQGSVFVFSGCQKTQRTFSHKCHFTYLLTHKNSLQADIHQKNKECRSFYFFLFFAAFKWQRFIDAQKKELGL